jgi:hypothetical protein
VQENHADRLGRVLFAYRTAEQESTGKSPFQLLYGRVARIPADVQVDVPLPQPQAAVQYTDMVCQELRQLRGEAETKLSEAQLRQAPAYNRKLKECSYVPD